MTTEVPCRVAFKVPTEREGAGRSFAFRAAGTIMRRQLNGFHWGVIAAIHGTGVRDGGGGSNDESDDCHLSGLLNGGEDFSFLVVLTYIETPKTSVI